MNSYLFKLFILLSTVILLSSCQLLPSKQSSDQSNNLAYGNLQNSLKSNQKNTRHTDAQVTPKITPQQALSSLVSPNAAPQEKEERFNINVKNTPIQEFLLGLVSKTPFNLIVSPDLDLKVSLQLNNITVTDTLSALTRIYPLVIEQKDNLIFVSSATTMTRVYPINYLNLERSGESETKISGLSASEKSQSGQQSGGNRSTNSRASSGNSQAQTNSSKVKTITKANFWKELQSSLELIIKGQDSASVIVSPHAGIVVVRAEPKTQRLVSEFLDASQNSLDRQVIIEAKIIEVSLNEGFQAGIDWSKIKTVNDDQLLTFNQQGQVVQQTASDTPLNGLFSMLYQGNSFAAAIDLLKSQGQVQVLSSPRVATVNNQKAIIKVGADEFFVTDVSTTTVTGTSTATTPDVTLTPFFSGISLDVTPQINQMGDIVLHIHPIVSEVTDQKKVISLGDGDFTLPLALTNVRESDSIVRTQNGNIIVIGGLMQNQVSDVKTSTPLLGDIPIVGNLFKQTRQQESKSELVILLKAHVIDNQTIQNQLIDFSDRFKQY